MREAIVLAGGFGTRLKSVVNDVPKPMAPVAGRPFLSYLLDSLIAQNYRHVVLATGYMHETIEEFYGKSYRNLLLNYAVEHTPLGTGGAIVNALQHCDERHITVLNGDTLFLVDHNTLIEFAQNNHTSLTLVLRQVSDAGRYGSVSIDSQNRITDFHEKESTQGAGLINGGIYRIDRDLLCKYRQGQPFSFERDVMQRRFRDERFFAIVSKSYFIDIGIPDDYARAQDELPSQKTLNIKH